MRGGAYTPGPDRTALARVMLSCAFARTCARADVARANSVQPLVRFQCCYSHRTSSEARAKQRGESKLRSTAVGSKGVGGSAEFKCCDPLSRDTSCADVHALHSRCYM